MGLFSGDPRQEEMRERFSEFQLIRDQAVCFSHVSPSDGGGSWGLYLQNTAAEPLLCCRGMQESQGKSKRFLMYDMCEVDENL